MSQKNIMENLLIDFNNIIADDQPSDDDQSKQTPISDENIAANEQTVMSMPFHCSSEPLYKLLSIQSDHIEDNNPFDHLDKQAGLLDDPFEIVENAALASFDASESGKSMVETGTLISIDSPVIVRGTREGDLHPKTECDISKTASPSKDIRNAIISETKSNDSVQNASQKQLSNSKNVSQKSLVSPSGKSRSKAKNTSLNLLKYSLSNSRLDLAAENGSQSDEQLCGNDIPQMKHRPDMRRDSGTDDSFDDIWATKPNLIDSQTDIDADSDLDNDIAKLNIPMLNNSMRGTNHDENMSSKADDEVSQESPEEKAANRNEILEKLASIKQKIPQSPMAKNTSTIPGYNQTVNIKVQEMSKFENEPVTPKSQYSSVVVQKQQLPSDNPNSLIENLKKLVDQCDDKSKQNTANHLLDDLKSILTTNANESIESMKYPIKKPLPQLIKRQGTFSLEKSKFNETPEDHFSRDELNTKAESNKTDDRSLSQVVKNIQNVLESQNINVLKTEEQSMGLSTSSSNNPTYIVVMAQQMTDFNEDILGRPHRIRSQSLTLKEKPLAAIRANQHKIEQSRIQPHVSTPTKRPVLQRRSSFGTITRTASTRENEVHDKPSHPVVKPDVPKVIRRRSFQGQPQDVQSLPSNSVSRRRSFQGACTGIRSPSPKGILNSDRGTVSHRLSSNTTATLTRRKSFSTGVATDSPPKLKSSYGIMKKPAPPSAARNLKIRVSQTTSGRSTAPLRAVVPMNRVSSLLLINETVSPVNNNKSNAPITSTPRSISSLSPAKSKQGK